MDPPGGNLPDQVAGRVTVRGKFYPLSAGGSMIDARQPEDARLPRSQIDE